MWHEARRDQERGNKTDEPTPWKFNSISDSAGVTGVYFTPHCAVQTLGENYSLHFRGSSGLNNTAEWDLPGHTVDLTFLFSLRSSTLLTVLRGAKQGWRMSNIEIFAPLSSLLSRVSPLVFVNTPIDHFISESFTSRQTNTTDGRRNHQNKTSPAIYLLCF